MSTELGKTYIGVDRLLGLYDSYASEYCPHGVNVNSDTPCPECDLDDATRGEQDSLAAADESFSRINP